MAIGGRVQSRASPGRITAYGEKARDRILREAARSPTTEQDGTATWSLAILRRVLRAAPDGQAPTHAGEIIRWFEAVAARWNDDPTPFVWGGDRAARRRHRVGGSGATTRRPLARWNGYSRAK
jgi:hypothetical protein